MTSDSKKLDTFFFGTQDGAVTVFKRFQKTRPGYMSKTADMPDDSSELLNSDSKHLDTMFSWNSRWNSNCFEAVSEDKTRVHEQND